MNGGATAAAAVAVKSILHKPLHELTEDDISQLTREDCRRFLKEKGMRRPSWNKSQAIQQVICLKSLLEPSPPNAAVKRVFRPPLPPPPQLTTNTVTVNSSSFSSVKELSPAEAEESVTAMEDRFSNQAEGSLHMGIPVEGECAGDDIECSRDRCEDASKSQFDRMTIFYSGKVNVYNGVPVDKMPQQARAVMQLAASPVRFSQDEPSCESLPNLNNPCQLPSKGVKLNLATSDAPILQSMLPGKISDHVYYRAEGNNVQEQDVENQTNRQVSLQRYFDKRKDRGKSKMKRKIGTSSSGLEIYLSHQMKAPLPITNSHNSEAKTGASSQFGLPQTRHETKETHLKSLGLSVDLNDKVQNNHHTKHLVKLLIHFSCCLQDCTSVSVAQSISFAKTLNAAYFSSVFLKYAIENSDTDNFEDLYLALDDKEAIPSGFSKDLDVEYFVIHSVLKFICTVEASPHTYQLHCELLDFLMISMSTQLLCGPSPGPKDVHPFGNAVMVQEASLATKVVQTLLVNYISQPQSSVNDSLYSERSQPGVFQMVGSTAANLVLSPLNLFVGLNDKAPKDFLGKSSLNLLLVLVHFRKCAVGDEAYNRNKDDNASSDALSEKKTNFYENPFCQALQNARNVDFDRADVEGNAHCGPLVRISFASLYDTIGLCLTDEAAALLLYSLIQGNPGFLEYVLVRTDIDTLLMPILEMLYNAPMRTSNQIYMLLVILLILSQDSTLNASMHKLILSNVPWYKERNLHHTSLGSLMVVVLIRTVKYNLARLQDVYLHTNCLATLANMAPHIHCLSGYASQRLVSLFHMLSRKYTRLADIQNDKLQINKADSAYVDGILEDVSMELHIYTDFLRIVLEIINAILSYALPRNPEFVYAVMHGQEIFQPYRNHPRFNELLENIFTVLDFFDSRMDAHEADGEWSVEKALQVITDNCRIWRSDGMKMFTQLRFTYEQESHPEEFFIPYVWQLVVSHGNFAFNPSKVKLFSVDQPPESRNIEVSET